MGTKWEQTGNRVGTLLYDEIYYLFIITAYYPALCRRAFALVAYALCWNRARGVFPWHVSQRGGAVDNFIRIVNLSSAYFLGSVHNFRKCMFSLKIPDNVQKVTHNTYFIRRALC